MFRWFAIYFVFAKLVNIPTRFYVSFSRALEVGNSQLYGVEPVTDSQANICATFPSNFHRI